MTVIESLWGEEFNVPEQDVKNLIKRVENPKVVVKTVEQLLKSKKTTLEERLALIRENVIRILGRFAEKTQVIRKKEDLVSYIDHAIENGIIALDTETNNSLQPITCKLMGPCLYTPGLKNAYVPINHKDPKTDQLLENQLTEEDIAEQLQRLTDTKIIMHNGKFDYKVFKCTTGVELKVFWDTLLAAKILNENEEAKLKSQYINHIDSSIEKYSIEHLFEGVEYAYVDPEIFALYAATDSFMTYELYEWQKEQFEISGHERLYHVFKNVEMPVLVVTAEMELTGIEIDLEYTDRLAKKYHKLRDDIDKAIEAELLKYEDTIQAWRNTKEANYHPPKKTGSGEGKSLNELLETPINLGSPSQLAILLYDILKVTPPDPKKPRGTGEDELKAIKLPLCKLLLERRGIVKLIDAFIDSLPNEIIEKTGRVHASFNQAGTATGRYSCSSPNLQQIPSKNKDIRLMFKAADGNVLVGSDYSQQEPRLLAHMTKDEALIGAYKEGKDLYAIIATGVFKNNYWDNMEHHEDGTPNPEGKKRRKKCKTLLLAIMYGMGMATIAEMLGCDYDEAKELVDGFYGGFPKVKAWMDSLQESCRAIGYVEDPWGRRRRLPDIQRERYELIDKNGITINSFNPLIGSTGISLAQESPLIKKYKPLFQRVATRRDFNTLKKQAEADGLTVQEWSGTIAKAERQCVNACIQGGAATLTKMAMVKIHNDPILNELGFKLSLAVHDELIGECPEENSQVAADRLCKLMIEAAAADIVTPFKCDPTIEESWAITDYKDSIKGDYDDLVADGMLSDAALKKLREEHSEASDELFNEIFADVLYK